MLVMVMGDIAAGVGQGGGWLSVWAKSSRDEGGQVASWLPLQQHLDDAAAVARRLVQRWVPLQVRARVGEDLPNGVAEVPVLAGWLAAVHDVGKASPAFAVQVPELAGRMRRAGLPIDGRIAKLQQRGMVTHSLVGHAAVRDWLFEHGFDRASALQLAVVVGGHHGVPPEIGQLTGLRGRSEFVGTGIWADTRRTVLSRAAGQGLPETWRTLRLTPPSQALLTAIVIVADWIASNEELFPLWRLEHPPEDGSTFSEPAAAARTAERLEHAWARLRLPGPWTAPAFSGDVERLLRDRFGVERARPVQRVAVEAARDQPVPGLIIVEAPMGAGKTEAALAAAEVLAGRSGAGGCFVALPTQATADAMFSRVRAWLDRLPRDHDVSLTLAHGKAALNEEFDGVVRAGRFTSVGIDEPASVDDQHPVNPEVIAHQWLSGRKKGVLASFVVGTVDQVLFAGLKSRHLALRHLALAGKVVIIDEVHAYDVYMSQYLHRVLHWLGAYQVPVVLLSATLPHPRRNELIEAYRGGTESPHTSTTQNLATTDAATTDGGTTGCAYPAVSGSRMVTRPVRMPSRSATVALEHLDDEVDTLIRFFRDNLAEGGCAAVVHNTVGRVQRTAAALSAEFGVDAVTVNHAQFLSCDRARRDRELLARFGPPGDRTERPRRHIVVASQVLEQSLDVDFDLMVTDLAPADLVLQRVGRLHRHHRDRPTPLRQARCALVGVTDWDSAPPEPVPGSRAVYGEHPLLRAVALLGRHRRSEITLPTDISPLVQIAYSADQIGPSHWWPTLEKAREDAEAQNAARRKEAGDFLLGETGNNTANLIGWVRAGVGDTEDTPTGNAQVRDGHSSVEVLVVHSDSAGGLLTADHLGAPETPGQQLPTDQPVPHRLAKIVAGCTLRLPHALSHPGVVDSTIAALEQNYFASFQHTPLLAGQLVLLLQPDRTAELHHNRLHKRLTYDPRLGLLHADIPPNP
jgi:CRISPR-associated helicase Cas3/CRISPR-associated endonuclease Cas3-HD